MKRIALSALVACLALVAGAGRPSAAVTTTTLHSFDRDDGWQPIGALTTEATATSTARLSAAEAE